jgi:hypothetical protein
VIARAEALPFVEEAIASSGTLYDYAAQHPERETVRGRTAVFVIPGPSLDRWLVRRLSHGGLLAPLTGDRFLGLGTPRPFNEIYMSLAFRDRAIPTPDVTAATVYSSGMIYRGEVARELITDAADLAACLFGEIRLDEAQRHEVMTAAGALLASLFDAGVIHRDLNIRNVLVKWDGSVEAYILDIEKCASAHQAGRSQRRRAPTSSALSPSTSTTFSRPLSPFTTRTADLGTPSFLARNAINSAFAAPSTGGAVSLIFTESP